MNDPSKENNAKPSSEHLPPKMRRAVTLYQEGESVGRGVDALFYLINVVRAVLYQFNDKRIVQRTAGVAYFLLVGFVPMVMMLIVATDIFGFTHVVGEFVVDAVIELYLPVERNQAIDTVTGWIHNLQTGFAGGIGLIAVAYAALNAFNGLYLLINDLWQQPLKGSFWHKLMAALATMFLVPIALFASTWLTAQFGGLRIIGPVTSRLSAFALIFVIILIFMKITTRAHVTWRNALISSLLGALAFEITKFGFAFYVQEMMQGSWFSIYGAIFLIPVFMLWNLITATVIAAVASTSWVLQHPEQAFADAGIRSAKVHTALSAKNGAKAAGAASNPPSAHAASSTSDVDTSRTDND